MLEFKSKLAIYQGAVHCEKLQGCDVCNARRKLASPKFSLGKNTLACNFLVVPASCMVHKCATQ